MHSARATSTGPTTAHTSVQKSCARMPSAFGCRAAIQQTRDMRVFQISQELSFLSKAFADEHFDTVVCNSNLEHLFYLDRNVAECLRVLKRGGTFIWMEPNSAHWRYRLWLLAGRWPYIENSPTDPYHIRHLTAYELQRHCTRNGLVVRELIGHAGLWCRPIYPSWFYARGVARVVRPARVGPGAVRAGLRIIVPWRIRHERAAFDPIHVVIG